jgi:putative MFS transporter
MWIFACLAAPVGLIAAGVAFTLVANIMSYAYHAYQTELYPTRIRAQAIGFVYSWSRIAAAFGGLGVGYLRPRGAIKVNQIRESV